MDFSEIGARGLVLLGCGKMGGAMLEGWLSGGLSPDAVWVIDPYPSEQVQAAGVHVNEPLPASPAVLILAVKPQMMGEALGQVAALGGGDTLMVSIAAGTQISVFEEVFGKDTSIVRAMPNTPAERAIPLRGSSAAKVSVRMVLQRCWASISPAPL